MTTWKKDGKRRAGNGRATKYNNHRIKTMHGWFDSKGELQRWLFLLDAEKRGIIRNLKRQVEFPLIVNDELVCTYVADFVYEYKYATQAREWWPECVEDFKGFETDIFKLKAKLFSALMGSSIKITKSPTEEIVV